MSHVLNISIFIYKSFTHPFRDFTCLFIGYGSCSVESHCDSSSGCSSCSECGGSHFNSDFHSVLTFCHLNWVATNLYKISLTSSTSSFISFFTSVSASSFSSSSTSSSTSWLAAWVCIVCKRIQEMRFTSIVRLSVTTLIPTIPILSPCMVCTRASSCIFSFFASFSSTFVNFWNCSPNISPLRNSLICFTGHGIKFCESFWMWNIWWPLC